MTATSTTKPTPKRKTGRPPLTFDQKIADRICEERADGKSIRQISKMDGMPSRSTIRKWRKEVPEFESQYAHATEESDDFYFDELMDLQRRANASNAHAIRVKADIIKWALSKLKPKKYGDRLELSGEVNLRAGDGDLPGRPFIEWSAFERIDWAKRICYLTAMIATDVRGRLGLGALADAFEKAQHELWRAVQGEKKVLPAPKVLPGPVREEKTLNPREAQGESQVPREPPPFRGSKHEMGTE